MSSTIKAQRFLAFRPSSSAVLDIAIAAGAFLGSLAQFSHGGAGAPNAEAATLDLLGVALVAGSAAPLVLWRRFPLGVFTATATASVLLAGLGYRMHLIHLMVGPTAALYLLASNREPEVQSARRMIPLLVALLAAYLVAAAAAQGAFPGGELHTALAWAVAWFAGERTRLRRAQVADLSQRALRAERDVERERLLAVAEERARIARDLHDSAGHAISVIAVRAGAARLRHHEDPSRSLAALEAIEQLARQTVDEIDGLVGTLRERGSLKETVEAPPGLASLDALIAQRAAAGLEVTLETAGTARALSPTADRAAYRILQEGLTNAARHGTGHARVELAFRDAALELTITNSVPAGGSPRSAQEHGLIGMRERASLVGGNFESQCADGTFRVRVSIPYGGCRL